MHHVIVSLLNICRGVTNAPRSRHVVKVAALDHTREGVEDDAGAKHQRLVILPLTVRDSRVAALSKDTTARFLDVQLKLSQPNKLLNLANGQRFAVCIY